MPITPGAQKYYTDDAIIALANFEYGGDTLAVPDSADRNEITYEANLRNLLDTYCSMPEQAAAQVKEFLLSMPTKDPEAANAFMGLVILTETRRLFQKFVGEERELAKSMRDTTPPVDLSAAKDSGPSTDQLNRAISDSAKVDDADRKGLSDGTVAKSAWGENPDVVDKKIEKSARGNPHVDVPKPPLTTKNTDTPFQEWLSGENPDFFGKDPVDCFRASTRYLVSGLICIGTGYDRDTRKDTRVEMLVRDKVITGSALDQLKKDITELQRKLQPPSSETQGLQF